MSFLDLAVGYNYGGWFMNIKFLIQKGITQSEIDVLKYLVTGLKNEEIAKNMYISVSTVKKHLESIYEKLSVHNRLQAIYVAFIEDDIIV